MKEMNIYLSGNRMKEACKIQANEMAAQAERSGLTGVYERMRMTDELDEELVRGIDEGVTVMLAEAVRKKYLQALSKMTDASAADEVQCIELRVCDLYPYDEAEHVRRLMEKFVVDWVVWSWMLKVEAGSALKNVGSPLAAQQEKMIKADTELIKQALEWRRRPEMNITKERRNDICIIEE